MSAYPTSSSSADSGTSTSIVESRNKGLCKCMVLYLYHTIHSRNTVIFSLDPLPRVMFVANYKRVWRGGREKSLVITPT